MATSCHNTKMFILQGLSLSTELKSQSQAVKLALMEQFRHVEANCSGMVCPPYNNYKELNCVVCTKETCRLHVKQTCEIMFGVCHRKHISDLGLLA